MKLMYWNSGLLPAKEIGKHVDSNIVLPIIP